MNGFFIKDYDTRRIAFTTAVYDDKLCFVVRSADLVCTFNLNNKVLCAVHVFR